MILSATPHHIGATHTHTQVASWQGSTKRDPKQESRKNTFTSYSLMCYFSTCRSFVRGVTPGVNLSVICRNFQHHVVSITLLPLEDSHGIWGVLNIQILRLFTNCCETCRWLSTRANSTCISHLLAGCHVQAHSVLGKLVGNKRGSGEVKKKFRFFYRSVADSPECVMVIS